MTRVLVVDDEPSILRALRINLSAREYDVSTAVDGTSGLVVSIMNKHYTFAKFLLDRGADPNVTDAKGRAALYAAVDIRNEDWSALPSRKLDDPYPSARCPGRRYLRRGAGRV